MKEFIRDFLPYKKLSPIKGTILLLALAIWSVCYLPYFENMGDRRFFSYNWDYFSVYLQPGMFNALVNDFLSQLSQWPLLVLAFHYILSVIFLACAYRAGGRYAVFMMPFWLISSSSVINAEQDFAIEMLAGLVALSIFLAWISFREERNKSPFFYEAFYLHYWLYYVGAGFLLLYLNGASILLFYGSVVFYRFFILVFSLSKKGKENLETAVMAFGIYFITGTGICFTFPKAFEFPTFLSSWGWEEWISFGFFIAAIAANLYHSSHRRNLNKPSTSTWPFLITGLIFSMVLTYMSDSPEKRSFIRSDNAIERNEYASALKICNGYFSKHPSPQHPERNIEQKLRWNLSLNLRLSLLMENRLLEDFFQYKNIPEMQGMIPYLLPHTGFHNFTYSKLYQETGLYGSAIPILEFTLENYYHQIRMLRLLLPMEIQSRQYTLASKWVPMMKKSIGNRKFTRKYEEELNLALSRKYAETPLPIGMGLTLSNSHFMTDILVREKTERQLFGRTGNLVSWQNDLLLRNASFINSLTPLNKAILDYYTLLCLLRGELDHLPRIIAEYPKMEIERLPQYVQEGLAIRLLQQGEITLPENADKTAYRFMGYEIEKEIITRCQQIHTDFITRTSLGELKEKYGNTYTFHYYMDINPPEVPYQEAGSYCI